MNTKKLVISTIVLFAVAVCEATTYYVDTASSGEGDGTTQELTGPHAAWKIIAEISGLSPGDSVLFHRGDTWTETLAIFISGDANNIITFGAYGTGEDPLIDVSGNPFNAAAILLWGIDYVEIKNFRLKGSGGAAAVTIRWGTEKAGSGALGDGYTVVFRDINVLSNYGASEGNHDGFSLHATYPSGSSQALFYNITATKCRHATEFGGSHQCLTTHERCKAKVYTANFSDSVNWYASTQGGQAEFYNLTASSSTSKGIATGSDVTSENLCIVSDSNLTVDGGGGLCAVSASASQEGPRIIIQDSHITASRSFICYTSGNMTLLRNVIDINDPSWRIEHNNGLLTLQDNTFICSKVRDWAGLFHIISPGYAHISGNTFKTSAVNSSILCFDGTAEPPTDSEVKNNVFRSASSTTPAIRIQDDTYAPGIHNNVFYGDSSGVKAIDLNHDGDEAESFSLDFKNNIFYNIADVVDALPQAVYSSSYNCYYGGEVLGDTGSITADPLFIDAGADDFHLKSEGWRWDRQRKVWTWDNVTSRCIDAGNPGTPLGDELLSIPYDPDNDWGVNVRVDIGAYGGTDEASMPPYDWALLADLNNDGEVSFEDLAMLSGDWLNDGIEQASDLNRDDTTNLIDFALLSNEWLEQTTWFGLP